MIEINKVTGSHHWGCDRCPQGPWTGALGVDLPRACLVYELRERGFFVEDEKPLPVTYKGVHLDCGYRIDLLVEDRVIVELKSVNHVIPIHQAQLLSYLKLSGKTVGLLINFNVNILATEGVRRVVNNYLENS